MSLSDFVDEMDTVVSKLPDGAVLTLFCGFCLGKKCYYNIEKENRGLQIYSNIDTSNVL